MHKFNITYTVLLPTICPADRLYAAKHIIYAQYLVLICTKISEGFWHNIQKFHSCLSKWLKIGRFLCNNTIHINNFIPFFGAVSEII